MHDSFHQLIQEQSLRVAEEGLELLQVAGDPGASGECVPCGQEGWQQAWVMDALGRAGRSPGNVLGRAGRSPGNGHPFFLASAHQVLLGDSSGPVYSTATLSILASMPSRTIGEQAPCPCSVFPAACAGLGFLRGVCEPKLSRPVCCPGPHRHSPVLASRVLLPGVKIGSWECSGAGGGEEAGPRAWLGSAIRPLPSQAAAEGPSSPSTTTARYSCGAGAAGAAVLRWGLWCAPPGPASACTTWSWTPQPCKRRVSEPWPVRGWGPGGRRAWQSWEAPPAAAGRLVLKPVRACCTSSAHVPWIFWSAGMWPTSGRALACNARRPAVLPSITVCQ